MDLPSIVPVTPLFKKQLSVTKPRESNLVLSPISSPLQSNSHIQTKVHGRDVAQARLPTEAARVRTQVMSCGICGGQSGTGVGFLRVLRFPLPNSP
jgi:hypothetical protein